MGKVVFHIGLHKTASTWLQKKVFSQLSGVEYFGHDFIYEHIIDPTEEEFSPFGVRSKLLKSPGGVKVCSSERLSGNPHSGYYDNALLADRMRAIAKDAKILLVLREQKSMLVSCYKQYVKSGGFCMIEEYIAPVTDGRIPLFDASFFEYDAVVSRYVRRFGSDNVLVLPFELLKSDLSAFLAHIGNFIGLDCSFLEDVGTKQNVAMNDFQIATMRMLNVLGGDSSLNPHKTVLYGIARKIAGLVKKYGHVRPFNYYEANYYKKVDTIVGERYAKSNQRLKNMLKNDVSIDY